MTNPCPYCKDFEFHYLTFKMVHEHVIACSKKYIDDHLLKYYVQADTIKRLGDRPVLLEERRGNTLGRRKVNDDRRQNCNTLYTRKGVRFGGLTSAGFYLNVSGCVEKDRRETKGLGRRNSPQRRQR